MFLSQGNRTHLALCKEFQGKQTVSFVVHRQLCERPLARKPFPKTVVCFKRPQEIARCVSDSRRLKRHRGKLSRAEPGFLLASLSSSLCGSPCLQSTPNPNPVKSLSSLSPHGCAGWGSGGHSGGASSWYWTPVEVKAALRPVPAFQKKRNEKEGKAELRGVFQLLALSRSTRGKRRGVAGDSALFLVTAVSLPFLCTPVSIR